jgi:hypothetical protein
MSANHPKPTPAVPRLRVGEDRNLSRQPAAPRLGSGLGHASIQMTFDRYGHLFPSKEDDHAKFAAMELSVVG